MTRKLLLLALVATSTWFGAHGCGATDQTKTVAVDAGAGGVAGADDLPSSGGARRGDEPVGGVPNQQGGTPSGGKPSLPSAAGQAGDGGSSNLAGFGGASAAGGEAGSAPVDPRCADIAEDATLTAHLQITADNECEVFVNGASAGSTTNWGSPVTLDVSLFVHPGRSNVIAVRATNTSSQDGNDRGMIGALKVGPSGAETELVITDGAWRSSKTEIAGWTELAFDDSAWPFASVVADNGAPPWGALLSTPSAKWLWSDVIPASTLDKPNLETAYLRRGFYFAFNGSDLSTTPACPAP